MQEQLLAHIADKRVHSLADHVKQVAYLAGKEGRKLGIENIMELIGLLHDMGKAGDNFQEYLRQQDRTQNGVTTGSVNHSSAGARWFYTKFRDSTKSGKELTAELISYTISSHHGLYDITTIDGQDKYARRITAEPDCYVQACKRYESEILCNVAIKEKFLSAYGELMHNINRKISLLEPRSSEKSFYYGLVQRLFLSILIDADWTDTAMFTAQLKRKKIEHPSIYESSLSNFHAYMSELRAGNRNLSEREQGINALRDEIQEKCIAFAENPNGIYCLPVPTAGGKTLSSLAHALEYAKRNPETEKIIYVSHFLSVIEQNAGVIKKAVGPENAKWVLEHHSNVVTDREYTWELNWEEPFICTTMVQFFQILFSDKKQSIRLFHRLKNAVIILDEVQSLPVRTIHTFNLAMNFLKEVCNTTIILCTATQPLLGEKGIEHPIMYGSPKNMIENVSERFERFRTVTLTDLRKNPGYTYEDMKQLILELLQEKDYQRMLVILNSKYAVGQVYEAVKEQVHDREVIFLTTDLCAEHRKRILDRIKKRAGEKLLIISTSLVEAGVDLSVSCVIRSMAGLDSIAQAAGRCDRNGEYEIGEIFLVNLADERTDNMQELLCAIRTTEMVLDSYKSGNSTEDLLSAKWMDCYYRHYFFERKIEMDYNLPIACENNTMFKLLSSGVCSEKPNNRMLNQAFQTAGERYHLILNETIDVIVPFGAGKTCIDRLDAAEEMHDIYSILHQAQPYMVSLYGCKINELLQKGMIRQCEKMPDIYIATFYDQIRGVSGISAELIY